MEDFDPSALLYHAATPDAEHQEERRPLPARPSSSSLRGKKAAAGRKDGGAAKKVWYETKAARMATRATQRARRTEKAERAGGKAARKRVGGKKPGARK